MEFLEWQYLIFELPFALAVVYLLANAADFGHHEVGHDVSHDISDDVDGETEIHHHDQEMQPSLMQQILGFFGIGRVPISIILEIFLLSYGFFGFFSNKILAPILHFPVIYAWASLGIAIFLGLTVTKVFARSIAKIMPTTETFLVTKVDFIGKVAEIQFCSGSTGIANVRDSSGTLHQISVIRINDEPLRVGQEVFLISYDKHSDTFKCQVRE